MNLWVLLIDRENLSIVLIGFRAISLRQGGPAPTRKVRKAIPDHPASAAHDQFRSELLAWDVYILNGSESVLTMMGIRFVAARIIAAGVFSS
jgi:hypothetical protein